jgi:hypothetical protein
MIESLKTLPAWGRKPLGQSALGDLWLSGLLSKNEHLGQDDVGGQSSSFSMAQGTPC